MKITVDFNWQILMKIEFSLQIFEKFSVVKFHFMEPGGGLVYRGL